MPCDAKLQWRGDDTGSPLRRQHTGLRARQRRQRRDELAVRLRELVEDRKMIVTDNRQVLSGEAALLPCRRELRRLSDQLRQLAEPDGDDQRRRARRKMQHRAVASRLVGVEAELLVE